MRAPARLPVVRGMRPIAARSFPDRGMADTSEAARVKREGMAASTRVHVGFYRVAVEPVL